VGDLAWPRTPDQQPPPVADSTIPIQGSFTMEMDFGSDTSGYSTPGTIETLQGGGVTLSTPASDPDGITISTLTGCGDPAVQSGPMTFSSGGATYGYVNWFTGRIFGTVKVKPSFTPTFWTECGAGPLTATPPADPLTMTLAYEGSFRFSPAISADGRLRLGVMKAIDTAPMLQTSVFGLLSACAPDATSGTCDPASFPQRLKVKTLTADLLLGGGA
jgi:hypothetical protein